MLQWKTWHAGVLLCFFKAVHFAGSEQTRAATEIISAINRD